MQRNKSRLNFFFIYFIIKYKTSSNISFYHTKKCKNKKLYYNKQKKIKKPVQKIRKQWKNVDINSKLCSQKSND